GPEYVRIGTISDSKLPYPSDRVLAKQVVVAIADSNQGRRAVGRVVLDGPDVPIPIQDRIRLADAEHPADGVPRVVHLEITRIGHALQILRWAPAARSRVVVGDRIARVIDLGNL